ncbi:MAG: hypothetical protein KBD29_03815 [Candidatus Magasanikbacteria bacterium]|nr:hypothetical protein [Candidatus Magasanikbacteria bacterium]
MKNSLFFLLAGLLVLGTVALIVYFGTEGSQVNREAPKDLPGPQQNSEYVKIRVDAPSPAEIHAYSGGDHRFGSTPFEVELLKSHVCAQGVVIHARTPTGVYPWWDSAVGTLSKSVLIIEIDGAAAEGKLTLPSNTCDQDVDIAIAEPGVPVFWDCSINPMQGPPGLNLSPTLFECP